MRVDLALCSIIIVLSLTASAGPAASAQRSVHTDPPRANNTVQLSLDDHSRPALANNVRDDEAQPETSGAEREPRDTQHDDFSPAAHESTPLGKPTGLLGGFLNSGDEGNEEPLPVGNTDRARAASPFDDGVHHIIQVAGALIIVIALIFATRFLMVRSTGLMGGAGRPSGVLEILARYPIARGQSLVLLKMARRVLLIHQTGSSMTTLSEFSDPNEVGSLLGRIEAGAASRDQPRFRNLLEQFQRDHQNADRRRISSASIVGDNDSEIVDLTKRPSSGLSRLFGGSR